MTTQKISPSPSSRKSRRHRRRSKTWCDSAAGVVTVFKWFDELKRRPSNSCQSDVYYSGFRLGELNIRCGQCVLMRTEPSRTADGDSIESYDIARLLTCYYSEKCVKTERRRGSVQWYSRLRSIPFSHRIIPPGVVHELQPDLEIIQENRNYSVSIDLETIVGHCYVEECPMDVDPTTKLRPAEAIGHYFVCRFAYGAKKMTKSSLQPISHMSDVVAGRKHSCSSPGKENIPPGAETQNVDGDDPLSPSRRGVKRSGADNSPAKKLRRPLQEVGGASVSAPIPHTSSLTPAPLSQEQQKQAKKTPNRNLDMDFDKVDNAENRLVSPKQKVDYIKQIGNIRPLNVDEISLLLESNQENGGTSDADQSGDDDDFVARINPIIKLTDIIKMKSFTLARSSQGERGSGTPEREQKHKVKSSNLVHTPKSKSAKNDILIHKSKSVSKEVAASSPRKTEGRRRRVSVGSVGEAGRMTGHTCRCCQEMFTSKKLLMEHEDTRPCSAALPSVHEEEEETPSKTSKRMTKRACFVCPVCNFSFSMKTSLEEHFEDEHSEDAEPLDTPKRKKKSVTSTRTPSCTKSKAKPSSSVKVKPTTHAAISTTIAAAAAPATPKGRRGLRMSLGLGSPRVARPLPDAAVSQVLERARARLHVSAVPDSLPCREEQFQEVYDFVEGRLNDGTGGCMYISGVPGTGKTATVREVVRLLKECQTSGELPPFNYVEVNALTLAQPKQVWSVVWEQLTGQAKVSPDHAVSLLERRFRQPGPCRQSTLLLVDELDMLWTRKQDVLYNLFEWPCLASSQLVVVAIANTMDLPERVLIARVASRLGLTRVTFHPYTHPQLQEIVTSRLQGVGGFEPDAIQLVARKVAAVSGDARRALDICRRATELAEVDIGDDAAADSCKSPMKSPLKRPRKHLVGMRHVDMALREMFTSPKITAIRCCSVVEQRVLRAVVAEVLRTGVEEASLERVHAQFLAISAFDGSCKHVGLSMVVAAVNRLSGQRLLLSDHSSKHLSQRVRLNLSVDDVNFALKAKKA